MTGSAGRPNGSNRAPDKGFDSGPGLLELKAHRLPGSVSVHGDVFVAHVTWVFVSLHDETGRVVGWTSVSVPGPSGLLAGPGRPSDSMSS